MTWTRIEPPTNAEIEAFCVMEDLRCPQPGDDPKIINSFASYLVAWLHEEGIREGEW